MTAEPVTPVAVEVDHQWTVADGVTCRTEARFDSIEQARGFRDELNAAIASADRRGPDRPAAFTESVDGQEWARAFLERFGVVDQQSHQVVDEDRVTAWFEEAIERGQRAASGSTDVIVKDLGRLLVALELGDHARPASPHEVVLAEVLPAIERLRKQLAEAWPDRPRLAGTVRLVREGARQRIEVDGRRFPWDVAIPVNVPVSRKDRPSVLLQLMAERVEVVDTIAVRRELGDPHRDGGSSDAAAEAIEAHANGVTP